MGQQDIQQLIGDGGHIILFDGQCNLCSAWVYFIIKRDPSGIFRFCSVQSEPGAGVLKYFGLPVDQIETMVYVYRGDCYVRSSAFLRVVKMLPALWPWLSLGVYIPEFIRDGIYNFIAKNRYRVAGRRSHCLIPTEDNRDRFIE